MKRFYFLIKDKEIIAIIEEKNFKDIKENEQFKEIKNIELLETDIDNVIKFLNENKKMKILSSELKKELKHKLYIEEIVSSIKEQLLIKKDMDLIIPERAYAYINEIENVLKNQGVSLKNSLRECINDLSPFDKFEDKLKREAKIREGYVKERE